MARGRRSRPQRSIARSPRTTWTPRLSERKNRPLAEKFLEGFAIGKEFDGTLDFDKWAVAKKLLPRCAEEHGSPGWRFHLDQRRKLIVKINRGADCKLLDPNRRFRVRCVNRMAGRWLVEPLHQSARQGVDRLPYVMSTHFKGYAHNIDRAIAAVDLSSLTDADARFFGELTREWSFMKGDMRHAIKRLEDRRALPAPVRL